MRELQGAIIIGSAFQAVLGYSGLMSLILRYTSLSLSKADTFHIESILFGVFLHMVGMALGGAVFTCIHNSFDLLYRLVNPVVVAPTIAAVGLSFYSYGFPLVGKCLEIGVVQILLVIIFALVSFLTLLLTTLLANEVCLDASFEFGFLH